MGDYFQTIVDPEATGEEALALARRVLDWLVGEQVVVPERTDCTLGEGGYAPGSAHFKAIASPGVEMLPLRTNGLEITAARTVFFSGPDSFDIVCPACDVRFESPWDGFSDAVGVWYDRSGPGMLVCPGCGMANAVTDWHYDPPFGFGDLGLTFWNWPKLSEAFVATVGEILGHRVFVVHGKI